MDCSMVDEWSTWPYDPYFPNCEKKEAPAQHAAQAQPCQPDPAFTLMLAPPQMPPPQMPKGENPREIRNKAEKQRRDKMNKSIAELAQIVPPVVATGRKMDKTSILKLTAHYLRAHQYVFGDSINSEQRFSAGSAHALLGLLKGFVLTTTYKGIVVVVSQNVHEYLGYTELELIGKSIFDYTHADDRKMLREQLMPRGNLLGTNGELLIPDGPDGTEKVVEALAREKRSFVVRFKKLGQRSGSNQYVTCHIQGTLRKADKASRASSRCCQMVRRVRSRGDNPRPCGNDVVFVGLVRPTTETFMNESNMESFRMEYRTRHSIDGEIIECESRIALVTGYMTHEVNGVNAMNFMHRDDVRWVIIALREMYDQHRLVGESCYRLMTKNGKFIYMQTRGYLDVNKDSRAVTSFVCTNTVVDESVGKRLIKLMKKKFTLLVNNGQETDIPDDDEDTKELSDDQSSPIPVEDPRQLQKVILHLVTNLPSPQPPDSDVGNSLNQDNSFPQRLAIIPPRKERIVSAIEKIYSVIKPFNKEPIGNMDKPKELEDKIQVDAENEAAAAAMAPAAEQELQDLQGHQAAAGAADEETSPPSLWMRRRNRMLASTNRDFETPVASTSQGFTSSQQPARADRHYLRPSSSRTRFQPQREAYPEPNVYQHESHTNYGMYYGQQYIPPANHYAPIDAPSTSRGTGFNRYFRHDGRNPGHDYSSCAIKAPQCTSDAGNRKHDNYNSYYPSMENSMQFMPRFMADEYNNNLTYPDCSKSFHPDMSTTQPPVQMHESLYVPYERDQFEDFPSYNQIPYQDNPISHTQTSDITMSGCGTKRQNDFLAQNENVNKKPAPQYPNEAEMLPATFADVPPPPANTSAILSFEIDAMTLATSMGSNTTTYANATVATTSPTFCMATAQDAVPLYTAEEANTAHNQAIENANDSEKPADNQDTSKIEIDDSVFEGNCLEPNNCASEEETLEQALGEDFPDVLILAECEKLEKIDSLENEQENMEEINESDVIVIDQNDQSQGIEEDKNAGEDNLAMD